ncbi:MAG: hypothetical protein RIQ47_490 [Bacteroidota bacterium]|jgi:hypothetical protein
MSGLYDRMSGNLLTRFFYFFVFHFAFWIIVFESLYFIWPDELENGHLRNVVLAALLGTLLTILLHGVKILSGDNKSKKS